MKFKAFSAIVAAAVATFSLLFQEQSIDHGTYTVTEESVDFPRKFNASVLKTDKYIFTCWEEGVKELTQNSVVLQVMSHGYEYIDSTIISNDRGRIAPINLISRDDTHYLFYQLIFPKNISKRNDIYFSKVEVSKKKLVVSEPRIIEGFDHEVFMDVKKIGNEFFIPFYDYDEIGYIGLDSSFKIQGKRNAKNVPINKYFEPSLVKQGNSLLFYLRTNNSGYINWCSFDIKHEVWSEVKETEVRSPSSINRCFQYEGGIYLVHNNIKSLSQGPRNSLDISLIDTLGSEVKYTYNVVYHPDHFFSNFNIFLDDSTLFISYQRLLRKKHPEALDKIEIVSLPLNTLKL